LAPAPVAGAFFFRGHSIEHQWIMELLRLAEPVRRLAAPVAPAPAVIPVVGYPDCAACDDVCCEMRKRSRMSLRSVRATRPLFPEMLVEEAGDLDERLLALRHERIEVVLRVRHALKHLQLGLDAGAAQLAMGHHREAQEKIARAAGQDGGRKAG